MVRRVVPTLLLSVLALAGCGKSNFRTAVIVEPAHATHDRLLCNRRPTPAYCSFDLRRLLGHKLRDAERLAHSVGFHLRVIERDRHRLAGDLNFDTGRVDVATESGIVTEIRGIG